MPADSALMEKLTALCKRRGFIFPGSEIYGGLGGFWDYGPLGVELKRNVKDLWWRAMVTNPPIGPDGKEVSMVGLDCAIIMNPEVWKASGHVGGFSDPMVDCRNCKARFRADTLFSIQVFTHAEAIHLRDFMQLYLKSGRPGLATKLTPRLVVCMECDSMSEALAQLETAIRAAARATDSPDLKKAELDDVLELESLTAVALRVPNAKLPELGLMAAGPVANAC